MAVGRASRRWAVELAREIFDELAIRTRSWQLVFVFVLIIAQTADY
jgi:hypothetical protein